MNLIQLNFLFLLKSKMRQTNEVTFSRPTAGLWQKQASGLLPPRPGQFLFYTHQAASWSPGSASKKEISNQAFWLHSLEERAGLVSWSTLSYSFSVLSFPFAPSFCLPCVCLSASRSGSSLVSGQLQWSPLRCRRANRVGEEVSHQREGQCWWGPLAVSATHPGG